MVARQTNTRCTDTHARHNTCTYRTPTARCVKYMHNNTKQSQDTSRLPRAPNTWTGTDRYESKTSPVPWYLHKSWTPTRIQKRGIPPSHTQLLYTPPALPRIFKHTYLHEDPRKYRYSQVLNHPHRHISIMDPSRLPWAPNTCLATQEH